MPQRTSARPSRRPHDLAHPWALRLLQFCGSTSVTPVLRAFVNESHHIHLRAKQWDWLRGDIWPAGGSPELDAFVAPNGIKVVDGLSGTCRDLAERIFCFYSAWLGLLWELRHGAASPEGASDRVVKGMLFYNRYLITKDLQEPLFLQEAQLARLFRASQAIRTGTQSPQCVCQVNFQARLESSFKVFESTFRFEQVALGGIGDTVRDKFAAGVKMSNSCPQDETVWTVPWDYLSNPPADQVLDSTSACLPMRILMGLSCGQSALVNNMVQWAKDAFTAVRNMLLFAIDCFDETVSRVLGFGALDIFAYLGRLHLEVNPSPDYHSFLADLPPMPKPYQPRRDRQLVGASSAQAGLLPPLCTRGGGPLLLRASALPPLPRRGLRLQCRTGVHSLVPVEVDDVEGYGAADGKTALFMRVDTASWTNLGHAFAFLVPYAFAVFRGAFAAGGLDAAWALRDRLRLYVTFPGRTQEVLQRQHHAHLLPWLSLFSSEPPVLLQEPGQPAVDAAVLPRPLQQASQDSTQCHAAGLWGTDAGAGAFSKVGFDLFADLARGFPPWQVDREALARRVWGAAATAQEAFGPGAADPCVELVTSCIRVLVVQRGTFAQKKRRVVNLDDAVRQLRATYGDTELRVALVEMEAFTLQEEVALAAMTDVLVGSMGSGMWWAIFMPEGACVVWLLPKLTWFRQTLVFGNDSPTPLWEKSGSLEYKHHRNLWHVNIYGRSPPELLPGSFEPDAREDVESVFSVLELDVYLDVGLFLDAFAGITRLLGRRLKNNGTRSSMRSSMRTS